MRFDLIRLMLLVRQQGHFWEARNPDGSLPTREEWLRMVFSRRIDFDHRGARYSFVPAQPSLAAAVSGMVTGKVGRQRVVKENEPPDQGLEETEREQWKAVEIVVDPRAHDDGQKAALAFDKDVGQPLALMRALADALNSRLPPAPYVIEANGIVDPNTFWHFVQENEGEITSVTFELVAPNMFGIRNDLDREMRELRENEKARKAKFTLQNEDGLHLTTDRVRETANYTAEGGGNIAARTKKGKRFNSKNKTKSAIISDAEMDGEDQPSRFRRIIQAIFD
ncbi:hypothetical protein [Microvirga sp. TS319]|uniref:hypothetical protein n=1 Tax=Microvirga sp. TS319 TaxID=3241165 RepID=UPI00351A2D2B